MPVMSFHTEPAHYNKTILTDLQGAWGNLRAAVIEEHNNNDCTKLLFHIDEAMSWESVRDLSHMKKTVVLIQNIAQQMQLSEDVFEWVEVVRSLLYEVLEEIEGGNIL